MRFPCAASLLGLALLPSFQAPAGAAPGTSGTRRLALVVGANRGGAQRAPLRFAVADADRFASLVVRMGGVRPGDSQVLREPTRQGLLDALASTGVRTAAAKAEGLR